MRHPVVAVVLRVIWSSVVLSQAGWLRADPGVPEDDSDSAREARRTAAHIRWVKAEELCRFVVHGEVVDESGEPLAGVQVKYPATRDRNEVERAIDARFDRISVSEPEKSRLEKYLRSPALSTLTANRSFKLDVQNVRDVTFELQFSKEGYHPERVLLYDPLEDEDSDARFKRLKQLADGKEISPSEHERKVKIVMIRRGKPTKLLPWRLVLECSGKESKVREAGPAETSMARELPAELKNLPKDFLTATTEMQADGKTVATTVFQDARSREGQVLPRKITLHLSQADGGFQRFEPAAFGGVIRSRAIKFAPQMRVAPKQGYTPDLSFTASDVARHSLVKDDGSEFYVKIGKLYGRGSIRFAEVGDHDRSVTIVIHLELQADETTNLDDVPDVKGD